MNQACLIPNLMGPVRGPLPLAQGNNGAFQVANGLCEMEDGCVLLPEGGEYRRGV